MREILLLVSLFAFNIISGQTFKVDGYLPPSPNASSLATIKKTSTDLSSGTINVQIPLISVSSNKLNLDLGLAYNSTGNKLKQEASEVGLGWSLSGLSVITRSVIGRPDETATFGYLNNDFDINNSNLQDASNWDLEPDLYSYTVGKYSGKFVMKKDGSISHFSKSDLEFTKVNNGWKVITPEGDIYDFFDAEQSYSQFENEQMAFFAYTAWYPTKISSFDSTDQIDFLYKNLQHSSTAVNQSNSGIFFEPGSPCNDVVPLYTISEYSHDQLIIQSITTNFHKIDFVTTPRSDIYGGEKISEIQLKNKASGSLLKSFKLYHSNFGTNSTNYKLRLDSIQEYALDGVSHLPPYVFSYTNGIFKNKQGYTSDHWGYQNSSGNNWFLPKPGEIQFQDQAGFGNSYRNSDENCLSGMLERIDYPTGWYEEFEYELNDVGYLGNKSKLVTEPIPASKSLSCCSNPLDFTAETQFTVQPNLPIVKLNITQSDYCAFQTTTGDGECEMFIFIIDANGNTVYTFSNSTSLQYSYEVNLTPGEYTVRIENTENVQFYVSIQYYDLNIGSASNIIDKKVGGARVKSIQTPDGMTRYKYHTDDFRSSGILVNVPKYLSLTKHTQQDPQILCGIPCGPSGYKSTSSSVTGTFSSRHLMYDNVTVIHPNNGETNYEFDFFNDFSPSHYVYNLPNETREHIRGDLIKKTHYKYDNGQLDKTREEVYNYSFEQVDNVGAARIFVFNPYCWDGEAKSYNHRLYWKTLDNKIERQFSTTDSQNYVETMTQYTYDSASNHINPVSLSISNSNGKVYRTDFKYIFDYPSSSHYYYLINKNLIGAPICTKKFVDQTWVDGDSTSFSTFNGIVYPNKYFRYETGENGNFNSGTYSLQHQFLNYNPNGKPQTIIKNGWNHPYILFYTNTGKLDRWSYLSYSEDYEYYDDTNLIESIKGIDGNLTGYTYDEFLRLKTISDNCRQVNTTYDYHFANQPSNVGGTLSKNFTKITIDYPNVIGSDMDILETYIYTDGLGREIQSVRKNMSDDGNNDLIVTKTYDMMGRLFKSYEQIAYTSSTPGNYSSIFGNQFTKYQYYEDDLSRLKSVTEPSWYPRKFEYVTGNYLPFTIQDISTGFSYQSNDLMCNVEIDENGNKYVECLDKLGQKIASITSNNDVTSKLTTKYSYDLKNRLTLVSPPGTYSSSHNLLFKYGYYANDLKMWDKFPDADTVKYAYNNRDLLVKRQDKNLKNKNKSWTINYDDYGRIKFQGYNNSFNYGITNDYTVNDVMQEIVYGTSGSEIDKIVLQINHLLNQPDKTITSDISYDNCGRVDTLYQHTNIDQHPNKTEYFHYDASDNVLQHTLYIDDFLTVVNKMTFDHVGREKNAFIKLDEKPQKLLSTKQYNAKEQLSRLQLDNNLQTITYTYTPNNLLRKIYSGDDGLFSEDLFYDMPFDPDHPTRKNGDISSVKWKTAEHQHSRIYNYRYDFANRLKDAKYYEVKTQLFGSSNLNYNLYNTQYTYNSRGNLSTLKRYTDNSGSSHLMDDMTYLYYNGSNRVSKILDSSSAPTDIEEYNPASTAWYQYDSNGNVKFDPSRNAQIKINYLNLPDTINLPNQSIIYSYDVDGNLIRKQTVENDILKETRDYVGACELVGDNIDIVNHAHGFIKVKSVDELNLATHQTVSDTFCARVITSQQRLDSQLDVEYNATESIELIPGFEVPINTRFAANIVNPLCDDIYLYILKDHLQNNRVIFTDSLYDGTPNLVESIDYYPFGMTMATSQNLESAEYDYTYNGKERQKFTGYLNYGARYFDPHTSRFLSVDPLADKMPSWSPYSYTFNNPLKFTDPTGMAPESPDDWIRTSSGAIIYDASVKDLASTHERYGTKSQYLGKSLTFINGDGQQVSLNENGFALRSVLLDAVSITANRNENSRSSSVATTTGVAISTTDAVIDGSVSLAGATNELANTTKSIGKVTRVGSGVAGGIGVANDFASTVDNPSIGNGFKTGFSLGSVLYGLGSKSNPYITVGLGALDIIGVKDKIGTSIDKSIDYLQYQNFLYQQKLEVKSVRE